MTIRAETRERWTVLQAAASVGVVGTFVALIAAGLTRTRLWEDEAYNLSVPVNLAAGAGYRSAGVLLNGEPTLFDVKISTGPTVLGLIAPLIRAGIDPVIAGRLVGAMYALALLVGMFLLGRRIAGRWGGIAASAAVLIFTAADTASPIQGLSDVLGEIPAAAFLIFAVLVLRRNPLLAGVLLGLAIESKNLAVLAVPALVAGLVLATPGGRDRVKRVALLAAGSGIPVALFEGVKLVALGPEGYLQSLRALRTFLLSGGQSGFASPWYEKVLAALSAWSLPMWAVPLLLLIIVTALLLGRRSPGLRSAMLVNCVELTVVGVLLIGWTGWWLVSSNTPVWVRHPAPALLIAGGAVAALSVLGVRALRAHHGAQRAAGTAAACLLAIAVVVAAGVRVGDVYSPDRETLAEQRSVASTLLLDGADDAVHGPWGAPVSIAFLQGKRLELPGEGGSQDGVWIFPPGIEAVQFGEEVVSLQRCQDLRRAAGYQSCSIEGLRASPPLK